MAESQNAAGVTGDRLHQACVVAKYALLYLGNVRVVVLARNCLPLASPFVSPSLAGESAEYCKS